jgi:hypothetical protein
MDHRICCTRPIANDIVVPSEMNPAATTAEEGEKVSKPLQQNLQYNLRLDVRKMFKLIV